MKCFLLDFLNIFLTATAYLINVQGCIGVIGINIKTLITSNTQILISVGRLFVGFSSDNYCHLLQKSYLLLERVFSFLLHVGFWPVHNHSMIKPFIFKTG